MTPVSLFTHITLASATSSRMCRRAESRFTTPVGSMSSSRSSAPSLAAWCDDMSTALCSMGVVTRPWRPPSRWMRQPPSTARLSASVPPEVRQISSGLAPRHAAMRSRAASVAARASRPQRCVLDELPNFTPKYGSIASITSGRTGVVAAWSR